MGGRGVERHRVAVDRDPDLVEAVLGCWAVELGLAQVDQREVHVGAAREDRDPVARAHELGGDGLGAGDRAALALAEALAHRDAEGDGLRGDDVLERAALLAGEDRRVDLLGVLLLAQDDPRARAAERLVDRGGDHVGVGHGARVLPGRDEAGEVRHVDEEQGADLVGDLPEAREVQVAGVGRPARDDHLRPALARRRVPPRPCR
jgi:hypothetical protein